MGLLLVRWDDLVAPKQDEDIKVVTIGGGTGHCAVLSGLKYCAVELTAIVAMSDSGGSSGRLRDELEQLPPGDLRQCLVALSPDTEQRVSLRDLFTYRFAKGEGLNGHSLGNLFIAALTELTGDLITAIEEASQLLNIRGRVLPVTLEKTELCARLSDGTVLLGEAEIDTRRNGRQAYIRQIELIPPVSGYPLALEAIERADLVVMGPGDLYTSLLPNLLVGGICDSLVKTKAKRVFVCNLMTKPGETDGFVASDFIREIHRYTAGPIIDTLLLNEEDIPVRTLKRYQRDKSYQVEIGEKLSEMFDGNVRSEPLLSHGYHIRHDPRKLSKVLLDVLKSH